MTKRILSFILSIVMVFTMLPVQAFAQENLPEETTAPEETEFVTEASAEAETVPAETTAPASAESEVPVQETTEPVETTVPEETEVPEQETEATEIAATAAAVNAVVMASGTCGTNLTWELSDEGLLTISGSGAMTDYWYEENHPWHPYRESIVEVVIEEGVTSIGNSAFYQCEKIAKVSIANSVTSIGRFSFRECYALSDIVIPDGVTDIEQYAFTACYALSSMTLGKGIQNLTPGVLNECSGLQTIYVDQGNPSYCAVDGVLFSKDQKTLVRVPIDRQGSYAVPNGVTTIAEDAFNNSRLDSVTLPDGVITIAQEAFYAGNMSSVNIPDTVTSIGLRAFEFCALTEVTIPASVTTIENEGFYYCHWLETVTFEGDVPLVGEDVFGDDTIIAYYPGDNATWTTDKLQNYGGTITWVPYGQCGPDVQWVYDPVSKTLTLSGSGATYDYGGSGEPWVPYMSQMEHLVIGEDITYISERGFRNLNNLKTMTHPGELETWDCITDLLDTAPFETLTLTGTAVAAGQVNRGYMRGRNAPNIVLSEGITSIGEAAFMYCSRIQNLTLPESLVSIGEGAFGEADGLTDVTFPISLTSLEDHAFHSCDSITKITFRGDAPAIGAAAFTDVVADVYYPQDNATWTDAVKQNYGGTLNWVSYDRPMTQSEFEALLSGRGNITLNKTVTLTEDLTINLGSRIFTIGEEGMIIIPDGVKLTINSTTHIYGRLIQESGSRLETPTGNNAILNTFGDGFLYHADGASWSVSLNGQAYHEWDVLTGLTAKHLNYTENGMAVAEGTHDVQDSCRLLPGSDVAWIFCFREWDPVNYRFTRTVVQPEDLQVGPYLNMTVMEDAGFDMASGQVNTDCFVRVDVENSSAAWDNDSYIRYTHKGQAYDLTVSIRRDYDMGFYSSTVASNETYADNVLVHPLSDTGEIFFHVTNEEWNVDGVQLNRGAENFNIEKISDKVYRIILKPEALKRIYQQGGYNVSVLVDLSDGKGWEGHWGCGDVWFQPAPMDGKESAHFMLMGSGQTSPVYYSYYGALGGFGYIGEDGIIVQQQLPQGVSYEYATNTVTLDNAALADFSVCYSPWQDDQGNTHYDLPSQNLTVKLIGDNAISNHLELGGNVTVRLTGTGNITLGTTDIQPEALLRVNAPVAFDSGTVNQMGRMHIYDDVRFRGKSKWIVDGTAAVNSGGCVTVENGAVLRFNQGGIDVHGGTLTVEDDVQTNVGLPYIRLWLYDGSMLTPSVTGIDNSNILARSNVADFNALKQVIAAGEIYGEAAVSLTQSGFSISEDYTIPGNTTVNIEGYPDPITVEVPDGVTLTVDGTIRIMNGELTYAGTVVNNGTVAVDDRGTVTELSSGVWEGNPYGPARYDNNIFGSMEELKALIAAGNVGHVMTGGDVTISEDITLPENFHINVSSGDTLTIAAELRIPNGTLHSYNDSQVIISKTGSVVLGQYSGIYVGGGSLDVQSGGKVVFGSEWSRMEVWNGATVTGIKKSSYILMYPVSNETQLRQAMTLSGYKEVVALIDGDVIVSSSLTIPKGKTVSVGYFGNMPTLTVASGTTLTVKGALEAYNMGHVLVESSAALKNAGAFNISEGGRYSNYGTYIDDNSTYFVYHVFSREELENVLSLEGKPTEIYVHGDLTVDSELELPEDVLLVIWGNLTISEGAKLVNRGNLVVDTGNRLTVEAGGKLYNYGAVDAYTGEIWIHRYNENDLNNVVNTGAFSYHPENTNIDYCEVALNLPDAVIAEKTLELTAQGTGNPFTDRVVYWLAPESEDYATLSVKNGKTLLTPKYISESGCVITVYAAFDDGIGEICTTTVIWPAAQKLELMAENGEIVSGKTLVYDLTRLDENGRNVALYERPYPVDAQADLTWTSSDPSVATVDAHGSVTLKPDHTGTAVITGKDAISGLSASVTIETVRRPAMLTMVSADCTGSLVGGSKAAFTVAACDAEGNVLETLNNKELKWFVSDCYGSMESVPYASIDSKGKLTTKAVNVPQTICVMARYADGGELEAWMEVMLLPALTGVDLVLGDEVMNGRTIQLDLEKDSRVQQLDLKLYPYNISINGGDISDEHSQWRQYVKNWTWTSSKQTVASVDRTGRLTILGAGKTKITLSVEAFNGKKTSVSFTLNCGKYDPNVWVDTPNSQQPWLLESDIYLGELRSGEAMTFTNAKVTLVNATDKAYVTIGKDGSVKAKNLANPVEICLKVQTKDGYRTYENLWVNLLPAAQNILINWAGTYITGTTVALTPGESLQLSAENVNDYLWTTSNADVADVENATGTVYAHKSGTATITATATDGAGRKASVKIKVGKVAEEVVITDKSDMEELHVASGKALNLVGTVTFSDGSVSKKSVKWSVTDEFGNPTDLAKISASGKLTAVKGLREVTAVQVLAESKDGAASDNKTVFLYPAATGMDITSNLWSGILNGSVQTVDLQETSRIQLTASVYPAWSSICMSESETVTWKSSSAKIASVDKDTGLVTLHKPGTVTITAASKDNGKVKASFKLQLVHRTTEMAMQFGGISAEFGAVVGGKKLKLKPVLYAIREEENQVLATSQKVTWSLDPECDGYGFASIDSKGVLKTKKVTGKKTVTVCVTPADSPNTVWFFDVEIFPEGVSKVEIWHDGEAVGKSLTLYEGDRTTLSEVCLPGNGRSTGQVTWKSSNSKVAAVDEYGNVVCLKPGKATITATAVDGSGKKASFKLTVKAE